jgi:beta-lactamase class D
MEYAYNKKRMETAHFLDATFYIIASIIVLDEKITSDEKYNIPWDGHNLEYSEWNRDQTLATTYKYSCLWTYQQIIGRIGLSHFSSDIKRAGYGTGEIGIDISSFWLNGSLIITGRQQAEFLRRLYREVLPSSRSSQKNA